MFDKIAEAKHLSTFIITAVLVGLFLGLSLNSSNFSSAQTIVPCNQFNLFLARQANIIWGDPGASGQVTATTGSQVRLSVSGENGCAGQTLTFTIAGTSNTFQGVLSLGQQINGNEYQLYFDWVNNLQVGTYRFNVSASSPIVIQAGPSANELVIGTAQACNTSRIYANPNGGVQGDSIQLILEVQGTCLGWVANAEVYNAIGPPTVVWTLSPQTFSGGINRLVWNYTLPPVLTGAGQSVYYFIAHLGSQNPRSSNFIVCINQASCSIGSAPLPPVNPGQDIPISWNLTNPLAGNPTNVFEIVFAISDWILNIAGSLIVILIIYAGLMFLISRGNPGQIQKAKNILFWALVGFAVVLIGKGFIFLIDDVLRGNIPTFP